MSDWVCLQCGVMQNGPHVVGDCCLSGWDFTTGALIPEREDDAEPSSQTDDGE